MRRREFIGIAGGAAVWPLAARAQQKAVPVIGYLSVGVPDRAGPFLAAFRQGLSETGHVDGQTVAVEYRWAEGHYDRLPGLADDLVRRKVDVIVATPFSVAVAAQNATSSIPIVFISGVDPVAAGLVTSLPRPGGNLTGVNFLTAELVPKRIELISDLVSHAKSIALLLNPNNSNADRVIRYGQDAARERGERLDVIKAGTEAEIDAAFNMIRELNADGLVIGPDTFLYNQAERIAELALRHPIPASGESREFVAAGGLVSYGTKYTAVYREVGAYVGRILNGAKPADLPVQQPTKFELVINLKTAKALGLEVPPAVLARADEVIE